MEDILVSAPVFLSSEDALSRLKAGHPEISQIDAFTRQLQELFFIENREHIGKDKEEVFGTTEFKRYVSSKAASQVHVYFPWNNSLVTTVGKDDYFSLRTNRNQDLITAEEQRRLRDYKVAVFGLSVGSNIVRVLSQSGISNSIVVADFDELDTTNLNRILAGVHEIGINKAVITARKIYENDPFSRVTALTNGITEELLEKLLAAGEIDCIIDEVDDMPFKVKCRHLAIKYKKPVVMVTDNGDGVVLHVERYDLGLTSIFGKDAGYFTKMMEESYSKEAAGKMIMEDIVGGVEKVDPAMLRSVKRVLAKELVSWSQLGSAAILGGVMASYVVKEIALGRSGEADIRAYVTPRSVEWGTHA